MGQEGVSAADGCGCRDGDANLGSSRAWDGFGRDGSVRSLANILLITLVLALGACARPELNSFQMPTPSTMFRSSTVAAVREVRLRPVTPADLVDEQGRCAVQVAAAPPVNPEDPMAMPPEPPPMAALNPGGVALEMTECEVVERAGLPGRVDIEGVPGPDRKAVLTYIHGPRPGIYHFTGGRLTSLDRAPEPPAPPKPVKPTKPQKPQKRATKPKNS